MYKNESVHDLQVENRGGEEDSAPLLAVRQLLNDLISIDVNAEEELLHSSDSQRELSHGNLGGKTPQRLLVAAVLTPRRRRLPFQLVQQSIEVVVLFRNDTKIHLEGIEAREELRPPCLAAAETFAGHEVFQIAVVRHDLDRGVSAFKLRSPGLKCANDGK